MPEKEVVNTFNWLSPELWGVIGLTSLGWTYRTLISEAEFQWRKFAAEGVGAVITGIIIYSAGLMQGMTSAQMIFVGAMGGLGTVRSLEHTVKLIRDFKSLKG